MIDERIDRDKLIQGKHCAAYCVDINHRTEAADLTITSKNVLILASFKNTLCTVGDCFMINYFTI